MPHDPHHPHTPAARGGKPIRAASVTVLFAIASLLAGAAAVVSYALARHAQAPEPVALMALTPPHDTPTPHVARASLAVPQPRTTTSATPVGLADAGFAAHPAAATKNSASLADPAPGATADTVTFGGRPLRKVRSIRMLTTAYSPDAKSCGKWADGITASGYSVWTNAMKLVAADTRVLPFGTIVSIPGYNDGRPVPVLDRGGRIKGRRLDLLYPTHEKALQWGARRLKVTVWEYADADADADPAP